jgi:ribosomal protein S12 methylthiotransferase accessory factor
VASRIYSNGYEIMVVDLTSDDVRTCGYCVIKVMIPLLQSMEGDHTHQQLGGKRIYEVPRKLGYSVKSDIESLNPYPHPYP